MIRHPLPPAPPASSPWDLGPPCPPLGCHQGPLEPPKSQRLTPMPSPRSPAPSPTEDTPPSPDAPGPGEPLPCSEERARAAISWMVSARRDLGSISTVSSTLTCRSRQGRHGPRPPYPPPATAPPLGSPCPGRGLGPAWCPTRGARGVCADRHVTGTHAQVCRGMSQPLRTGRWVHARLCARSCLRSYTCMHIRAHADMLSAHACACRLT